MPLIKFVSDLQQVGGFLWVLRFPDRHPRMFSNKDDILSSKQSHVDFVLYVGESTIYGNFGFMFLFLRLLLIKFVLQQKVKYSNVIFLEQKNPNSLKN